MDKNVGIVAIACCSSFRSSANRRIADIASMKACFSKLPVYTDTKVEMWTQAWRFTRIHVGTPTVKEFAEGAVKWADMMKISTLVSVCSRVHSLEYASELETAAAESGVDVKIIFAEEADNKFNLECSCEFPVREVAEPAERFSVLGKLFEVLPISRFAELRRFVAIFTG